MTVREVRVRVRELRRDVAAVLQALAAEGDLVWVRVGRQRFLLVSGPDQVREVLVDRAEELAKPASQTIETGPPTAMTVDGGIPVPLLRRALAKGMGGDRIGEVLAAVADAAATETVDWRDGLVLRLMPRLRRIAIRWTCRASFASSLTDDEIAQAEAAMRWFDREPRVVSRRGRRLTPYGLGRRRAMARLAAVEDGLIANADLSRPTELTAVVRDLPEIAPSLTVERRKDLVSELFLGAAGPLTQAAGWTLRRFAGEPDAAARLREEWSDVLARDEPVDRALLPRLRYTDAFVREVTRLHPTNDRITRVAVVDTSVGGEPVPVHARVIVNVNGLHCDPRFYAEPERFLPERWLDGRPNAHRHAYVSFGLGGRRCLGETMALVSLAALLPALTRRWDLAFSGHGASSTGRRQLSESVRVSLSAR